MCSPPSIRFPNLRIFKRRKHHPCRLNSRVPRHLHLAGAQPRSCGGSCSPQAPCSEAARHPRAPHRLPGTDAPRRL
ncbi:hypothetical protein T484DRAFT_1963980 [Baffinella frigidus]|nr:hypothetical protein T484DRAFT_1963980 [Cryptophyta sp. CCMP2293]